MVHFIFNIKIKKLFNLQKPQISTVLQGGGGGGGGGGFKIMEKYLAYVIKQKCACTNMHKN